MQTQTHSQPRIHQLDNRLANQIAAGEVVERPSSVVKELLENSIDAGATKIEVDIERGGTRLIRVTDSGCGIVKEDLTLALSRHATSKINCSEDLAAINSLGFRGEALASIASVARLVLTSRTAESDFAWQAIAEGRDMSVKIQPASAMVGTRIEVRDLFYNTPARQKFLRAEKTEFAHIEEIFKRHALANHSTAFILKHNHKVVRRIPAVNHQANLMPRIEAVCGKPFAQNAIEFNCQHELVTLKGWTGGAAYHRSESDIQYVFVNNRPVKDKMLNHAIRQAFQDQLPPGRMPTFVMFLEINPHSIDVNVHPTKHEIRFDQQRMIHDLIVHSIMESLQANQLPLNSMQETNETTNATNSYSSVGSISFSEQQISGIANNQANYKVHSLQPQVSKRESLTENKLDDVMTSFNVANLAQSTVLAGESSADEIISEGISTIGNQHLIFNREGNWFIVNSDGFLIEWLSAQMIAQHAVANEPLLFPKTINLDSSLLGLLEVNDLLKHFGFEFSPRDDRQVILNKSPKWLRAVPNDWLFVIFVNWAQVMNEYFESKPSCDDPTSFHKALVAVIAGQAENIISTLFSHETRLEGYSSIIKLTDNLVSKMFDK